MPDVIITPNSGLIEFKPSSTTVTKIEASGNTFNLVNTANPSGTIFNVEATNGSLFSVVDNLSGTLMSVNNNAGLPVFEVFSDDRIVGGRFGQNDFVISSGGNIGIGSSSPIQKLDVRGNIYTSGNFGINNPTPSSVLDIIGESRIQGILYFNQNSTDANDASRNRCKIERSIAQQLILTGGANTLNLSGDGGKIIIRSSTVGTEIGGDGANTYVSFHPGSNTEKARITSIGNFGLGFTAPSGRLGVNGAITVGADYNVAPPINGAIIQGNVGIGTASPTVALDVRGASIFNEAGADFDFRVEGDTDPNLLFVDASTDRVGIGTSSPAARLDIKESMVITTSGKSRATFFNFSGNYANILTDPIIIGTNETTYRPIAINYYQNTPGIVISTAGNVGIGVSSPSTKLEVAGNINVGFPNENINRSLTIHSSNASNKCGVLSHDGGSFTIGYNIANQSLNLGTSAARWINGIYYYGGSHLFYGSSGANPLFIVDGITGNVGIGSNSPSTTLEVSGTIKATNFSGTGSLLTAGYSQNIVGEAGGDYSSTNLPPWGAIPYISEIGTTVFRLKGSSGQVLKSNGDEPVWGNVQYSEISGTVPTWNQNTTGTSAGVLRTVTGTNTVELVRCNMGDNDNFRILAGATASNAGYAEIATADDGTEPIHIRQYTGNFATLTRTATILDGAGNTSFPGSVTASSFSGAGTNLTGTAASLTVGAVTNGVYTSRNINTTSPVTGGGNLSADRTIALATAYGDTLNPYGSKTANHFLAAPNGTAGVPSFRAIVAADIPTLNQNTTGNAGTVTNGVYTTGNQTIGGVKTFNDQVNVDNLRLDGNTLSSTSGNIIINPSGTGAIQRDSGGNARGQYAVDWQAVRADNSQVASGARSVIGGGRNNTSSGTYSTVGGGHRNTSSGRSSTVAGGGWYNPNTYQIEGNTANGDISTIGGGAKNVASNVGSTVAGGRYNTSSGTYSTVGGGTYNSNSGYGGIVGGGKSNNIPINSQFNTVGGGYDNTSSGNNSTVGGGRYNIASGNDSAVGGGYNNTSSGNNSTVAGGSTNLALSARSFVSGTNNVAAQKVRRANNITSSTNTITVLGATAADFDNTTANALQIRYFYNNAWNLITRTVSTATQSGNNVNVVVTANVGASGQTWSEVSVVNTSETDFVIGQVVNGISNIASGYASTVAGGSNNTSSSSYSIVPGGLRAKSTRHGELSHAAGRFGSDGDAQHTILIARRFTTNATANQVLFLDGSSVRLTLPAETTWTFTVKLSAYNDTDNEGGWWIFRGGIRRNAANGTALIGSLITESGAESSLNTASASVVADDTNEALEIRVTGVASKNIRWVAVVDISQVSWGTP